MKTEQDYINDLTAIRSMMERSTKFMSLSGGAGILAGLYALGGAYIANNVLQFDPVPTPHDSLNSYETTHLLLLAVAVLLLALITAVIFSKKKANKNGEKIWNATSKRLIGTIAIPLVTGGLLMLAMLLRGFIELLIPMSLIFYGIAMFTAAQFTMNEIRTLGIIQIFLGLLSVLFLQYSLMIWAVGFGIVHIIYGIYMYYRYEK